MELSCFKSLLPITLDIKFQTSENPPIWNPSCPKLGETWLTEIWNYIRNWSPHSLDSFQHLPIIPVKTKDGCYLYTLSSNLVLKSFSGFRSLPDEIFRCLQYLSAVIVPVLPQYVIDHPIVMKEYVSYPSTEGILRTFDKLGKNSCDFENIIFKFNESSSIPEKKMFVQFLGDAHPSCLTKSTILLSRLQLFHQTTSGMTSVSHLKEIAPLEKMPVSLPRNMLNCQNYQERQLAINLGAREVKQKSVIEDILIYLSQKHFYSQNDAVKFMTYLQTKIEEFCDDQNVMKHAKNVKFVPSRKGDIKMPRELFDPREELVLDLFDGLDLFPSDGYCTSNKLSYLQILGLKSSKDITENELLDRARYIDSRCVHSGDVKKLLRISKAITKMLENIAPSKSSCNALAQLKFIFPKPRNKIYPKILDWFHPADIFCCPNEMVSFDQDHIVGSMKPLLPDDFPFDVAHYLGCNRNPSSEDVKAQLRHIISRYQDWYKPDILPLVKDIYAYLSEDIYSCSDLCNTDCVWNGNGFSEPKKVYLNCAESDIALNPYMFKLPVEFQSSSAIKKLFKYLGSPECQNTATLLRVQHMIKEEMSGKEASPEETRHNIDIIVNILLRVQHEEIETEKILFPIQTCNNRLVLKTAAECHYSNSDWLREVIEDEGETIYIVHERLPMETAKRLGVKSLTDSLLSDTEAFEEDFGQEEPLTRRISGLLDNYTDGFSVPKELVQNADDAGATKVRFLYDERENKDARSKLLHPNLSDFQGPALWAYNDKEFTKKDLWNIRKLNGATKEDDLSKIGKFGLGFCSVYNLTDLPCFVTGSNIVIFDPHAKYLGKVHGRNINMELLKNKVMFRRMRDQFKPFQKVFDCDLPNRYNGTLFRFPLRTSRQAQESDIRQMPYLRKDMQSLLKMFMEAAGNLLLFSQNIEEIELYHLQPDEPDPKNANLIFKVQRKAKIIQKVLCSPSIHNYQLWTPLAYMSSEIQKARSGSKYQGIKLSVSADIIIEIKEGITDLFDQMKPFCEKSTWIISWASGDKESFELAKKVKIKGVLPLASIAVQVTCMDIGQGQFIRVIPLKEASYGFYNKAHYFCFLPLPVESAFPININASFSVTSDRRQLCSKTTDDISSFGHNWNEGLFTDPICTAYFLLLETLKALKIPPDEDLYSIWPLNIAAVNDLSNNTEALKMAFVKRSMNENHQIFQKQQKWASFQNACFLDRSFYTSGIFESAFNASSYFFEKESKILIKLPEDIFICFENYGVKDLLDSKVITVHRFFEDIFFPNIQSPYWDNKEDQRDKLVLFAIDINNETLNEHLKTCPCIPTKPNGTLKTPCQLVHPEGRVYSLFSLEEERYIHGDEHSFLNHERLKLLEKLGIMKDKLSSKYIVGRAENIQYLSKEVCCNCALEKCTKFLSYLLYHDKICPLTDDTVGHLGNVDFLPVLQRPLKWCFQWKEEKIKTIKNKLPQCHVTEHRNTAETITFQRPKNLFLPRFKNLVGCVECLVDVRVFEKALYQGSSRTESILSKLGVAGLELKSMSIEIVMQQIKCLCTADLSNVDSVSTKLISTACDEIYHFFNQALSDKKDENQNRKTFDAISGLREFPIILIDSEFVEPKYVARSLEQNCSPYLYGLKSNFLKQYINFLSCMEIKEIFKAEDFLKVLMILQSQWNSTELDSLQLTTYMKFVRLLVEDLDRQQLTLSELELEDKGLMVPDENNILRIVADLCMDDQSENVTKSKKMNFVHDDVSPAEARILGIKTKKAKKFQEHCKKIFGPKEEITTRIKRLLKGYPADEGILKELLQNADDAQAKTLNIIKDFRQHGTEKVFDDKWKALQGPALCVYNDTEFKEEDIEGIQLVGIGSKGGDPIKTGQFGVGFNSVYHLTDAPSFLTKGPNVDKGETLCVFDPHCFYVSEATKEEPGIQLTNTAEFRCSDPDVFSCYPESVIGEKGTFFRFPLRNYKMAEESKLSDKVVTQPFITDLMESFKSQMFEMLLFVNSVEKIILSDISSGELQEEYSVWVEMSDNDKKKREHFVQKLTQMSEKIKKGHDISGVEENVMEYTLKVKDSEGKEQCWLIVQKVGFTQIGIEKIKDAYKTEELGLLPRGGVAVPILQDLRTNLNSIEGKAFCFLPLPVETGLPVHVNGHFVLDHEARRNLWHEENESYRSQWNKQLMRDVIALTYVLAIHELKNIFGLKEEINLEDYEFASKIYHSVFPKLIEARDDNWKFLVSAVLQEIVHSEAKVFIASNNNLSEYSELEKAEKDGKRNEILLKTQFLSLTSKGDRLPAVFDDIKDQLVKIKGIGNAQGKAKKLAFIFRKLGIKLLDSPIWLKQSIDAAELEVQSISPKYVITFLKNVTNESDQNKWKEIKNIVRVSKSAFGCVGNVEEIIKYCSHFKSFAEELDGLPLCLTNDHSIRIFSCDKLIYCTEHCSVLPKSSTNFVHRDLVNLFPIDFKGRRTVFKPFTIKCLSELLPENICVSKYCSKEWISWDPAEKTIPNKNWIEILWDFLLERLLAVLDASKENANSKIISETTQKAVLSEAMKKNENKKESVNLEPEIPEGFGKANNENKNKKIIDSESLILQALTPIESWCFLPCTITKCQSANSKKTKIQQILLPILEYKKLLSIISFDGEKKAAFKHLHLPDLDVLTLTKPYNYMYRPNAYDFLSSQIIACCKKPAKVLECLFLQRDEIADIRNLEIGDCNTILQYFSENCSELKKILTEEKVCDYLRSLPLYITIEGSRISLSEKPEILVIPDEIPHEGIKEWGEKTKKVLLKQNENFSCIFDLLKLNTKCDKYKIYTTHLLPSFHHLPQSSWLHHITHIKKNLLTLDYESDENQKQLINQLKNVHFIYKDGKATKASEYYSPHSCVMQEMCKEEEFPPEPYNTYEWKPFMELAGMKKDVTPDMFLRFARTVEHEGRSEKADRRSTILVRHLFQREDLLKEGILGKVASIRFVLPYKVCQKLEEIHPQQDTSRFICFSNSVISTHTNLIWSSMNIIDDDADPSNLTYGKKYKQIMVKLNIFEKPPLKYVLNHMQNVCDSLFSQFESMSSAFQACRRSDFIQNLMTELYSFVQSNGIDDTQTVKHLSSKPIVFLPKYRRFVCCNCLVVMLEDEDRLEPYLYPSPEEFGPYFKLFEKLGMTRQPCSNNYATVLEKLQSFVGNKELHGNELSIVKAAVNWLFVLLPWPSDDIENVINVKTLYLPSEKGKLVDSCQLVYCDNKSMKRQIGDQQGLVYFAGFEKLQLYFPDGYSYIQALPDKVRPKCLSELVTTEFKTENIEFVDSENLNRLSKFVHSEEFVEGVTRLCADAMRKNKVFRFSKKEKSQLQKTVTNLQNTCFKQVDNLDITLWFRGKNVGKDNKSCICNKKKINDTFHWNFYFKLESPENMFKVISREFCKLITECTEGLIGGNISLIAQLLQVCIDDPSKISDMLDQYHVREYSLSATISESLFPSPGTPVHPKWHRLLIDSFTVFSVGEYVALLMYEGDEINASEYIYGRVIEILPCDEETEEMLMVRQTYLVDDGNGIVEIPGFKMYKFVRRSVSSSELQFASTSSVSPHKLSGNVLETCKEIRKFLKKVWTYENDERRLIIKRLLKEWHPDKNIGNEETATEVFQYVIMLVKRLQNGEDIDDDTSFNRNNKTWFDHPWSRDVSELMRRTQRYEDSHDWSHFTNSQPVSQPGRAEQWHKQAGKDLSAAQEFMSSADRVDGFNWVCYMCHQVS
ncbi:hypothetical protein KUTeg_017815 [Tegillarca granosa]|uniref:RdRp catalytic domain-containing protein n=1 Tax=Tegillarca granosa TaxID=220873 RepID=A0ABQ9EJW5_TEGGR|nr:hypothetical protein KUTeg_017815 [Tegillarca granosa]